MDLLLRAIASDASSASSDGSAAKRDARSHSNSVTDESLRSQASHDDSTTSSLPPLKRAKASFASSASCSTKRNALDESLRSQTSLSASTTSLLPMKRMRASFACSASARQNTLLRSQSVTDEALRSQVYRSGPTSSLPPKKRISFLLESDTDAPSLGMSAARLSTSGGCYTNRVSSPNSEWTEATAPALRRRREANDLLRLCDAVAPAGTAKDGGAGRGSSRRRPSKKIEALPVKDVDGNDMCMGYFSMPPRKNVQAEERKSATATPVADGKEEEPKRIPTSEASTESAVPSVSDARSRNAATLDATSRNAAACNAARPLLYEAFLQALNQSMNESNP